MDNIADRFSAVIRLNTAEGRRWAEMEALTGIAATSWQKAYNRKQRPTAEMIEAVARLWPCFAFWLATGITDGRHGHVACRDGQVGVFFPERSRAIRSAARPYFEHSLEMFRRVYGTGLDLLPPGFNEEAQVKLLTLEMARAAEEAALSQAEDTKLPEELESARGAVAATKEALRR